MLSRGAFVGVQISQPDCVVLEMRRDEMGYNMNVGAFIMYYRIFLCYTCVCGIDFPVYMFMPFGRASILTGSGAILDSAITALK